MKKFESIEDKIESIISPIKITKFAHAKGDFISKRVKEICLLLGLPTYEIAFYLLTTKDEAKTGVPIIRDIYIAQNQEVFSYYCVISGEGAIFSMLDIRDNLDKRVAGWGHSHGDIATFFSQTDKQTFNEFLEDHRLYLNIEFEKVTKSESIRFVDYKGKNHIQIGKDKNHLIHSPIFDYFNLSQLQKLPFIILESYNKEIKYIYAMVFNAANDKPYTTVTYSLEGDIKVMDNIPIKEIDDGTNINFNTQEIDSMIKSRVIQIKNKINLFKKEIDVDYEDSRKILDEVKSIAYSYFNNGNEISISVLEDIYNRIERIEKIKNKYGDGYILQEEAKDLCERIDSDFQDFASYLTEKKDCISTVIKSIDEKQESISHWPPWTYHNITRKLIENKNICNYLIQFIDKYSLDVRKNDQN